MAREKNNTEKTSNYTDKYVATNRVTVTANNTHELQTATNSLATGTHSMKKTTNTNTMSRRAASTTPEYPIARHSETRQQTEAIAATT